MKVYKAKPSHKIQNAGVQESRVHEEVRREEWERDKPGLEVRSPEQSFLRNYMSGRKETCVSGDYILHCKIFISPSPPPSLKTCCTSLLKRIPRS